MSFPSVVVGLDVSDGSLYLFTGAVATVMDELASAEGVTDVARNDGRNASAVRWLIDHGWLCEAPAASAWRSMRRGAPQPPSWGTRESAAALAPVGLAPLRWYPLSAAALATVLAIRGLGSARTRFARIRKLVLRPPQRGMSDASGSGNAILAVRGLGRLLPLRVACLEESAASALALRWAGYRVAWRHGVATDPVRLHAWIEVDGQPVGESDDITDYTAFEEPHE
ncbi:lasso peptide biosynthesis B2 protein [Nocardiopsis sp. NPDC049922]|uniref:lasso peptide biosynthesis B2 protein n=1 Tax=Nocardiopsis sp. NPDC049922 TaxID=3155157 RepID=UPI003401EDCD